MNRKLTTKLSFLVILLVIVLLAYTPLAEAGCFGGTNSGRNISSVNLTSPANNSITGSLGENVDFSFRWYEIGSLSESTDCILVLDGPPNPYTAPSLYQSSNVVVLNLNSTAIIVPQDEGIYSWKVSCCGNNTGVNLSVNSTTRLITFDYSTPGITLNTPTTNEIFAIDDVIEFNFTPSDTYDNGNFTCTLYVDDILESSGDTFTNGTLGTLTGLGYSDGVHEWHVNCTDNYGNEGTSTPKTIIIDNTPPIITLNEPQTGTYFAAGSNATFNFTANESLDTENLTCHLIINNTVRATATDVVNDTVYYMNGSMPEGTFNWFVNCTDQYRNIGSSSSRSITYDGSGPAMTPLYPNNGYSEEDNTTIEFNLTFDDDYSNGSFSCDLIIDDVIETTGNIANGTNGTLLHTFTEDGFYDWYVNCTDPYGNTGSSSTRTIELSIAPIPPTLWDVLSIVGDSFLEFIGYIDKYGQIFATAQHEDEVTSNTNSTTTYGYANETEYLGNFPVTAVAPTYFTITDLTDDFENVTVGNYIRLSGHQKTGFTYYQINYIDNNTLYTRKINVTPAVEQTVIVGETMHIYDRPVPTGWFNISIELFSGTNNVTLWGTHLEIDGELTSNLVYYDSEGPVFNLSTIPNVTSLQNGFTFTIWDDIAVNLSTVYANASNVSNASDYEIYLYDLGVSYNTTNWTVANETITCVDVGLNKYNCALHPDLEDGNYTLMFNAADVSNHTSQNSTSLIVTTLVDPVGSFWHVNNQSTTQVLQLEVYWTPSPDVLLDYYELAVSSLPIDNGGNASIVEWFPVAGNITQYNITNESLVYGQIYYANIRPVDLAENRGDALSTELIYTLDPSPPYKHNISIIPDKGNWIRSGSSMSVTWNFTDNETGLAEYEYAVGIAPVSNPVDWDSVVAKTSIDANTTNFPIVLTSISLEEGETYYVSARAKNGYPYSSLWSDWYSSVGTVLDSLPPTGGWLSYETGQIVVSLLELTYAVGNDTGIGVYNVSGLEYAALKKKTATLYDNVCGSYNDWEIINASMYLGNPATYNYQLQNGKCYTFALDVYDFAGNVKTYEYTQVRNVSVDTTMPSSVIVDNTPTIIHETTLSFDWSDAEDLESGISNYQCALGTASSGANIADTVAWHNCSITSSATLFGVNLTNMEVYYFSVRAVNNHGLLGNISSSYGMLYFDIYPPAPLTVYQLANDTNESDGWLDSNITSTNVTIQLEGEDVLDCVWSYYDVGYVTGVSYTKICPPHLTNTSRYNCTLENITEGVYEVHVACQDTNGNEQSETQNTDITFTKDIQAPNITIIIPEQNDMVLPAEPINFTVNITDATPLTLANYTVRTLLMDELKDEGTLTSLGNGSYQASIDLSSYGGDHVFTVFSNDSLNRTSNETRTFLVNLDQPYVDLVINNSQGSSQRYLGSNYAMNENITLIFTVYFHNSFLYAITNASGNIVVDYSIINSSSEIQNKTTFIVPLNISDFETDSYTLTISAQGGLTNSTYNRTILIVVDGTGPELVPDSLERNPAGIIYENNAIQFYSVWEDESELAAIILSHNATGNWTNITAQQTVPRDWRPDEQRFVASLSSQYLETDLHFSYMWYAFDSVGAMNYTSTYPLLITNRPVSITTSNLETALEEEPYLQTINFLDLDYSQTNFNCSMNLTQPNLSISFVNNTHTCLIDWSNPVAGTYSVKVTVEDLKNGTVLDSTEKTYTLQVEANSEYTLHMDVNNYPIFVDFNSSSDYSVTPIYLVDGTSSLLLPIAENQTIEFEREGLKVVANNISLSEPATFFFRNNYTTIYNGGQLLGTGLRYEPLLSYAASLEFILNYNSTWEYNTGGAVYSSPQYANKIIYIGSDNGNISALNATTGQTIWSYDTGAAIKSTPRIENDIVYFGNNAGLVYALNATNGSQIWNYSIGSNITTQAAISGEYIILGAMDATVYALNKSNGSQLWAHPTGSAIESSPDIHENLVYIGSNDNKIYALNLTSGLEEWAYTTSGAIHSSPKFSDTIVYVGSMDSYVYALDALYGTQIWNYSTSGPIESTPFLRDGSIYIGSNDNFIYSLEAADGTLEWSASTGDDIVSQPFVKNGLVYIGSKDNKMYALAQTNGSEIWSTNVGGNIESSPLVVNDLLYFASVNTKVYAFEEQTAARNFTIALDYSYVGVNDTAAENLVMFKYAYDEPSETIDYSTVNPNYGMRTAILDTTENTLTIDVDSFSAFILEMDTEPPNCSDNIKNQNETDIDCGGVCAACVGPVAPPAGRSGGSGSSGGFGRVVPPVNCSDAIQNQNEVAIDCGGVCGPCTTTETCFDHIFNQNELEIDCGGVCGACLAPATCFDAIKNQNEIGVDCGGVCEKSCAITTTGGTIKPTKPIDIVTPGTVIEEKTSTPLFLWVILGVIVFGLFALFYLRKIASSGATTETVDQRDYDHEIVSIAHYIAKQKNLGFAEQSITSHLTNNGYAQPTIDIALSALAQPDHREAIVSYFTKYIPQGFQVGELHSWLLDNNIDRGLLALAVHDFEQGNIPTVSEEERSGVSPPPLPPPSNQQSSQINVEQKPLN